MAAIGKPSAAYDAIVVGGGHNGLVAAAYLAKAGLRTLAPGAAADPRRDGRDADARRRVPGARALPHRRAAAAGRRPRARPRVAGAGARRARRCGPSPRSRMGGPSPCGRARTRTAAELAAWSAGRRGRVGRLRPPRPGARRRSSAALGEQAPPATSGAGLGDAITGILLGRAFKKLSRDDARHLLRVLPMAVADFVGESFETDAVRATVAARAVQHTALGAWSMGTTATLLADSAGNDGGAAGQTVFARGGPGRARRRARRRGPRLRGRDPDRAPRSLPSRRPTAAVTGVALASGEEIAAPIVASGLDPKRTLLGLLGPLDLGPNLRWRAGNIRQPGVVARVNLALSALPRFPAAGDGDDAAKRIRGRILVGATGIDDLERAFDASKYGRVSDRLVLEATIPTLVDPSLAAREGGHVMSVIAQYVPYGSARAPGTTRRGPRSATGSWPRSRRSRPGIGALVTAREVLTPRRPRGRVRPDRRPPLPPGARPRRLVRLAAARRLGSLPDAGRGALPRRAGGPSRAAA